MMEHSDGRIEHLLVTGSAFFEVKVKVAIEQQMIGSQHEKKGVKRSGTTLPFGIRNGTLFNIISDVGRRFIESRLAREQCTLLALLFRKQYYGLLPHCKQYNSGSF